MIGIKPSIDQVRHVLTTVIPTDRMGAWAARMWVDWEEGIANYYQQLSIMGLSFGSSCEEARERALAYGVVSNASQIQYKALEGPDVVFDGMAYCPGWMKLSLHESRAVIRWNSAFHWSALPKLRLRPPS